MKLLNGRISMPEFEKVPDEKWNDWRWQKTHSVAIYPKTSNKEEKLDKLLGWLNDPNIDRKLLLELADVWAINVSPHLALQLARLRQNGQDDWYRQMLQFILPTSERREIKVPKTFVREGMGTENRRRNAYPDLPWNIGRLYDNRIVVRLTSMCPIACQFCFRQWDIAEHHELEKKTREGWKTSAAYVRSWNQDNPTRKIRDIILTGGDPMSLDDEDLEMILSDFKSVDGVEFLRIDSKYPAVLPQRITTDLVQRLKKFQPLMFQIHFTHPGELCEEVKQACDLLADGGFMLGSHTPLLRGVNDDRETLKTLFWNLLLMRVRPYYLIQSIETPGTEHFQVPVERGLELIKFLEADLDGPAQPHLILYTTGGGGKVHLQPQYLKERTREGWKVETWIGDDFYSDPQV